MLCTDVSPHLIFKNGPHPTLWPQDVPFPGEENDNKNDIAAYGGDDPSEYLGFLFIRCDFSWIYLSWIDLI